jgi:hypothetical protein
MARGTKGCCAFCVKEYGEIKGKTFDGFMPTKSGGIPLIDGKAFYQTELYALVWGITTIPKDQKIKVWTNSTVIKAWITNRQTPDDYKNLFDLFVMLTDGRQIDAEQVNMGQSQVMNKVRDKALELCDAIGIGLTQQHKYRMP